MAKQDKNDIDDDDEDIQYMTNDEFLDNYEYLVERFHEERDMKREVLSELEATCNEKEELENEVTKLKEEVTKLRDQNVRFDEDLKRMTKAQNIEKMEVSSKNLNDLLNVQLPASHKAGLGFGSSEASTSKDKGKSPIFVPASKEIVSKETPINKVAKSVMTKPVVPKSKPTQASKVKKNYESNHFNGCCYHCGRYGHRKSTCKFYAPNIKKVLPISTKNRFGILANSREYCRDYSHLASRNNSRSRYGNYSYPKKKETRCYACGVLGHIQYYCPMIHSQKSSQKRKKIICHKCKNEGHIAKKCMLGDLNSLILRKIEEFIKKKEKPQNVKKEIPRKVWKVKRQDSLIKDKVENVQDLSTNEKELHVEKDDATVLTMFKDDEICEKEKESLNSKGKEKGVRKLLIKDPFIRELLAQRKAKLKENIISPKIVEDKSTESLDDGDELDSSMEMMF